MIELTNTKHCYLSIIADWQIVVWRSDMMMAKATESNRQWQIRVTQIQYIESFPITFLHIPPRRRLLEEACQIDPIHESPANPFQSTSHNLRRYHRIAFDFPFSMS